MNAKPAKPIAVASLFVAASIGVLVGTAIGRSVDAEPSHDATVTESVTTTDPVNDYLNEPSYDWNASCESEYSTFYGAYSVESFTLTIRNLDAMFHGYIVNVAVIDPYALAGVEDLPTWSKDIPIHGLQPNTSVTIQWPTDLVSTHGKPQCVVENVSIQ
jgi:hypothetical protein